MRRPTALARTADRRPRRRRPSPEALEGRRLLATAFVQTNLVSDVPGMAANTDPNLVNPWGIAFGRGTGVWVANNHTGTATIYDGTGAAQPAGSPLVVNIPLPGGGAAAPTGQVFNATPGFVITSGANSGPASFLFATEDGLIEGWSGAVALHNAVVAVDNSASGAIYKGLAEGFNATGAYLYATDFHNGKVDVFDQNFKPVSVPGAFTDSGIPAGYAPFGIQNINSDLYVTYAKQDAAGEDDVPGAGHGYIDVYDTEGHLLRRFASGGALNSPWGMAWVPLQGYGEYSNALFVGNFGDGTVDAFDFNTGASLGPIKDGSGHPIAISGLWSLWPGSGAAGTSPGALYFSAGPNDETHGLLGTLAPDPTTLPPQPGPVMLDPNLQVTTVVAGLNQPTNMTFLGPGDFLILEKTTGKVQHVVNGAIVGSLQFATPGGTVLPNLPVNGTSERGLLGIALDPNFATNHAVYLYWTESSTGAVENSDLSKVGNPNSPFPPGTNPPLGNRVDRFIYNPATQTLAYDKNLIQLHAFQADPNQPLRGNHNSGEIRFGPDGKLYIMIGDNGRRGADQNLPGGVPNSPDDGPFPDNNHLTGVVLRLNTDGSAPADNPFANVTDQDITALARQAGVTLDAATLAEVVANVHKIFSYGRRNGFGLAFDPATGSLWESENGDDSFDEINRISAGDNGGWTQIMGPLSRFPLYKQIESTFTPTSGNIGYSATDLASFIPAQQQLRFPPSQLADTTDEALSRLFDLPGSHYEDPEFSWAWALAPAGIGFAGAGLGPQHAGDLFVGGSRTFLDNGYLFEFKLDPTRQHFTFSDPRLADKVADNAYKYDITESESLLAGKNFGIVTDVETGPDGNLYLVSLSNGAVYEVTSKVPKSPADLDGDGKSDPGVFRPSTAQWVVDRSTGGPISPAPTFGAKNLSDVPVVGDFDGVGHAQIGVFRPSTSQWFAMGPNGGHLVGTFGGRNLTDIPVPGDYDGTGKTEMAVFRPSTSQWFAMGPNGGHLVGTFGGRNLTDIPVPGDYDGVGHTEMAVYRRSTGQWFVLGPNGGHLVGTLAAPGPNGIPVPGDYDGSGKTQPAVYDPATGRTTVLLASGGTRTVAASPFVPAGPSDIPIEANFGSLARLKLAATPPAATPRPGSAGAVTVKAPVTVPKTMPVTPAARPAVPATPVAVAPNALTAAGRYSVTMSPVILGRPIVSPIGLPFLSTPRPRRPFVTWLGPGCRRPFVL